MMDKKNVLSRMDWIFSDYVDVIVLAGTFLVIAVLSLLGFVQLSSTLPILVLPALLILFLAIVRQRRQLNELHKLVQVTANNTLHDRYPDSYWDSLAAAKDLWITGLNLRRIVFSDHLLKIVNIIKAGGTLNVILLSRENPAMIKYGARQDSGICSDADITTWCGTIEQAEHCLLNLGLEYPDRVHIRRTDYPMSFGLDAVDIESSKGIIYVRYYPFYTGEGDKPILVLRANQSPWYDFYKGQLKMQWNDYATEIKWPQ